MNALFVSCPPGLEKLLVEELKQLGIEAKESHLGVYVPQEIESVYKINYFSRIATRVFWPLVQFPCRDKNDLYVRAKKIDWSLFFSLDKTFAIDANVSNHPLLRNSLFAAMVVKDAISDQFREKTNERPSVNVSSPDVQLNLFIYNGKATLSLDTSRIPLYKRGYRKEESIAPIQESIAAAILQKIGYTKDDIVYDPFCGSGTFLLEAAMASSGTPSGFFRTSWGFQNLPGYSEKRWKEIQESGLKNRTPLLPNKLFGSDVNRQVISICRRETELTRFPISFTVFDIKQLHLTFHPTLVITNPPYGKRLQTSADPYEKLGDFLRKHPQARSAVVCPEDRLIAATRIAFRRVMSFSNGGIPVHLYLWTP